MLAMLVLSLGGGGEPPLLIDEGSEKTAASGPGSSGYSSLCNDAGSTSVGLDFVNGKSGYHSRFDADVDGITCAKARRS